MERGSLVLQMTDTDGAAISTSIFGTVDCVGCDRDTETGRVQVSATC